jgi:neutral ceramidase
MMNRVLAVLFAAVLSMPAATTGAGSLRVGAAKVDITPPPNPTQPPSGHFEHEHLFVRAIVLDNGATRAALIGTDLSSMNDAIWTRASKQIAELLQCPVENIVMSATHSHSAYMPNLGAGTGPRGGTDPDFIARSMTEAVAAGKAKLQPARVGFGTGASWLNVNRDAINPTTRRWYQGPNLDGASDKTVGVVKFETPEGRLLAAYVNYAMHPINFYLTGITSADVPGAASRYVEQAYDDQVIVAFTQGASGNQNPLYLRPHSKALEGKRAAVMASGKVNKPDDLLGLMMAGDPVANVPLDAKIAERLERFVDSEGQVLGEEIIRVINDTPQTATDVQIRAAQKMVACPGRRRTNSGREGDPGTYVDGDPVNLRLGVLTIGKTALTTVDGEVYTEIAQRVKRQSPLRETMMVTLANGGANSGYIPTDAAFGSYTFQVLGSRLKPGCAENAIAGGLTELLNQQ